MIDHPRFLIIGATGRNTGKTEFACRLINKYSAVHKIIGIKVTSIDRSRGNCPRGKDSCGVCESLVGDFSITEETDKNLTKDTSRMLKAGANRVFWLKADSTKLKLALEALLSMLPENAMYVCESNSLRAELNPGLFLVIRNKHDRRIKASCSRVIRYADKVIGFDRDRWDFGPERIILKDHSWNIREEASAIILAGGKSTRMGTDKYLLPVNEMPLIQYICNQLEDHFDEILIGSNHPEKLKFLHYPIIPDKEEGIGPLMGIYSCLSASSKQINFITACDIPVMNTRLIHHMINLSHNADIVIPIREGNKYEPLYAVYRKSVAPFARQVLESRKRKIIELLDLVRVKTIDFENQDWYENLNEKGEYLDFIMLAGEKDCRLS